MSHTPGPWNNSGRLIYSVPGSLLVAKINEDYLGRTSSNIQLIAAAPDLLEALESMLQCANEGEPFTDAGMWECKMRKHEVEQKARAAIAKARGKQ